MPVEWHGEAQKDMLTPNKHISRHLSAPIVEGIVPEMLFDPI
jgi:hypothetical protein